MIDQSFSAWFALQTRPRHERIVARQLQEKGYDVFLPTWRTRRRWSDRFKDVELPLFEGYTFCRMGMQVSARVITTPGVIRIVGIANKPIAVDDAEIAALQRIVASCHTVTPWPFLSVGQRVRIESGGLAGLEGILESVRGARRIVVSIGLLRRSVAVELERDDVIPVEQRPFPVQDDGRLGV
jgi:transcription antitermination factor NusG